MAKRKSTRPRKGSRQSQKAIKFIISAITAAFLIILSYFFYPSVTKTGALDEAKAALVKVYVINVGQGDATLLEANGKFALIDTAEQSEWDKLNAYLSSAGVKALEYLAITHPHADHIGNAAEIINSYDVKKVLLPQFDKAPISTTTIFEKMLDAIDENNIPAETMITGNTYSLGDAVLSVLADGIKSDNQNNISPFIKFSDGNISFLCSGDAEKEAEQQVLDSKVNIKTDIFKAGHHGSKTSNSKAFLMAAAPSYVSISCGRDNSYGHPHKQAVESFVSLGAQYFVTAESGSIIFYADESGALCAAVEKEEKQ